MARRNIIKRIVSNQLVQALLIYVSGGWIALEITDYIITNYGLSSKVRDVLSIILLIGLPIAIFLSWYLGREKEETTVKGERKEDERNNPRFLFRFWRRRWFFLPGILVFLLLILSGIRIIHKQKRINWAMETALPLMEDHMHNWEYTDAFRLRKQVKRYVPDDSEFQRLDTLIATELTVLTEPEGVAVYYREYTEGDGAWIFLGTTPIQLVEMPDMSMFRWKMEKPAYETVFAVATTYEDTLYRTLHQEGDIPDRMIYVEGINEQITGDFLSGDKQGFYMDKFEVCNKEYKKFIDIGGYHNPEFWEHVFILNQDTLIFEEAMGHFKDETGRPGPATWKAGDYPDGKDEYPVNGISWFEAAAYAAYAGKTLPTMSHWQSAAGFELYFYNYLLGSHIIPQSNMAGEGPDRVGKNHGMSCFGMYDMSGNVREWCLNEAPAGRVILGGAWNDVSYMTTSISQLPAFDRSKKNGFRCAVLSETEKIPEEVFQPVELKPPRDYYSEEAVSDMEFEIMKKMFLYDKTALNSVVEVRDESAADWILEKISFDAAYEKDRMTAYLFLPVNALPPYHTLVYFPGSQALSLSSIFQYGTTSRNLYYILKNGRAVIFPIYKGTFERRDEICNENDPVQSHKFTECTIKWIKDLSRSIDYLESREDIDISKLGFMGDSWGGRLGALIPAVEDRIMLNIMLRGGFRVDAAYPEVDEFNYVTHVKIPTLMLNGTYDFTFPFETSVKPMFDLLGTPEVDKKLVICDTDHFIPASVMIKEVLNWLDTYFGTVDMKED